MNPTLRALLLGLSVSALAACASTGWKPGAEYDVVIRNGRVLDGAGNPWILADVAIENGRFARIGQVAGRGKTEIDARGLYVTPGWIDMLDGSGSALLQNGMADSKVRMGVTTAIAGEGGTAVPVAEIAGYFKQLERQGISMNFGTYYGATQARVEAMGDVAGEPSAEQMAKMKALVALSMEAGAQGISTALIYAPASFHSTAELVELAKVAAQYGGIYASHMRDESADLIKGINEVIEISEKSGIRAEIFHLKAAYAPGWGKLMREAGTAIEAARARGLDIAANVYPYTAGGTGLAVTVPNWVFADGREKGIERLKDPKVRARLKREITAGSQPGWSNLVHAAGGWHRVVLASAAPQYAQYQRMNIADIGKKMGKHPADAAWDIVLAGGASALYFLMSEDDVRTALRFPWTSIGSDASATVDHEKSAALGIGHPRAYGTFPRIIAEYVREHPLLTLEDAVRKMTSWPAARMGLNDRGVIRVGLKADVTIFDYDRIDDTATWEKPVEFPQGIEHVLVNGVPVIAHGRHTGAKPGEVLRGQGYKP